MLYVHFKGIELYEHFKRLCTLKGICAFTNIYIYKVYVHFKKRYRSMHLKEDIFFKALHILKRCNAIKQYMYFLYTSFVR